MNVPFIPARDIQYIADNFRKEFWGNQHPVNPLVIWEHRLNKYVDYVEGLRDHTNVEAYLTVDFDLLVLDKGTALSKTASKRLNFSIAHELGHYRLHRDFFEKHISNELKTQYTPAFYKVWLETSDARAYQALETQAHIFAAYLLMPTELVTSSFQAWTHELTKRGKLLSNDEFSQTGFRAYFASHLAEEFEVSLAAMVNCLDKLKIWPGGSIQSEENQD